MLGCNRSVSKLAANRTAILQNIEPIFSRSVANTVTIKKRIVLKIVPVGNRIFLTILQNFQPMCMFIECCLLFEQLIFLG